MNPILLLCYNRSKEQHDLTVDTLKSALAQDIPVDLYVVDNGSTYPETWEWLNEMANRYPNVLVTREETNISPIAVANYWMARLFTELNYPHILGIPNDVVMPSNLYRKMLEFSQGIVAATVEYSPVVVNEEVHRIHGDVHMAVPLVRKSAYDTLMAKDGYFWDEKFYNYCSDCDLKLRIVEAKISTAQLDIKCWHYGGASHRLAPEGERQIKGTDNDYPYFFRKWGFLIGSPEWDKRIAKINEER